MRINLDPDFNALAIQGPKSCNCCLNAIGCHAIFRLSGHDGTKQSNDRFDAYDVSTVFVGQPMSLITSCSWHITGSSQSTLLVLLILTDVVTVMLQEGVDELDVDDCSSRMGPSSSNFLRITSSQPYHSTEPSRLKS